METRAIPIHEFPQHLRAALGKVAEGLLTLQVVRDGKLMAVVAAPQECEATSSEGGTERPVFWDADTTALLQRSSRFRLGKMPSREERNER